jgi:hypothetical protein
MKKQLVILLIALSSAHALPLIDQTPGGFTTLNLPLLSATGCSATSDLATEQWRSAITALTLDLYHFTLDSPLLISQ